MSKSELSRVIGTRLQRLRKSKGYTQQMIADLLDLKKQTISGYEKGRFMPDFLVLMNLATFYDVSLDYICGRVDVGGQTLTGTPLQIVTPFELNELKENLRIAKKALSKLDNMEATLARIPQITPD